MKSKHLLYNASGFFFVLATITCWVTVLPRNALAGSHPHGGAKDSVLLSYFESPKQKTRIENGKEVLRTTSDFKLQLLHEQNLVLTEEDVFINPKSGPFETLAQMHRELTTKDFAELRIKLNEAAEHYARGSDKSSAAGSLLSKEQDQILVEFLSHRLPRSRTSAMKDLKAALLYTGLGVLPVVGVRAFVGDLHAPPQSATEAEKTIVPLSTDQAELDGLETAEQASALRSVHTGK